jgi:uncharacterized protein YkwD
MLVAALAAIASGTATGAPAGAKAERVASLEQGILRELNAARAHRGLQPLRLNKGLRTAAAGHAQAMLTTGFFSHSSRDGTSFSDRIRRSYTPRGFTSWTVGENILFDSDAIGAPATIAAWMASPPHRRNLFSRAWREVGIGVAHTSSAPGVFGGGSAWIVTMDFGSRTSA